MIRGSPARVGWLASLALALAAAPAWAQTTIPGFDAPDATAREQTEEQTIENEADEFDGFAPGQGFQLVKTPLGEVDVSGYLLARWLDQLPPGQTFIDHLGNEHNIVFRNDIQLHRVMVWLKGWVFIDRLRYTVIFWTANSTAQVAIGGNLTYVFGRGLSLGAGYMSLPGTVSMLGVFPYFNSTDRVMADEFFRPGFTGGVWITGEPIPRLFYYFMLGDNLSALGVNANRLNRSLAPALSIWWQPTTGAFGPRGGFIDYEEHAQVATRFGVQFTYSDEDRRNQPDLNSPDNTQIRLADSLYVFQQGSLAPGVTVTNLHFYLLAANAGMKYRGFNLQAEYYYRVLSSLHADGPLPVARIEDQGFYVQASYMLLPQILNLYAGTSAVLGGFNHSWEEFGGVNVYPFRNRNFRLNGMVIGVQRSAMNSVFGFYTGGQTGLTLTIGADIFF